MAKNPSFPVYRYCNNRNQNHIWELWVHWAIPISKSGHERTATENQPVVINQNPGLLVVHHTMQLYSTDVADAADSCGQLREDSEKVFRSNNNISNNQPQLWVQEL